MPSSSGARGNRRRRCWHLPLLITVLFDMAFVILAQADAPAVAAGVAWSTLLLVASLSGVRLFGSERDANTLTCLRLAPIDQSAVFVAKYVLLAAHVLAVGLVQLALLSVLLDLQLFQGGMLATLGLVTIALSAGRGHAGAPWRWKAGRGRS